MQALRHCTPWSPLHYGTVTEHLQESGEKISVVQRDKTHGMDSISTKLCDYLLLLIFATIFISGNISRVSLPFCLFDYSIFPSGGRDGGEQTRPKLYLA